jgi:hypothetical protein
MAIRFLPVNFKELDIKELRNRGAKAEDFKTLIDEDTVVTHNGKIIIVYIKRVDEDMSPMVEALNNIKYSTSSRTNGLITTSRIFGYAPRNLLRNHPCRAVSLASEQPDEHSVVKKYADVASKYYRLHNPELAEKHLAMTDENVKDNYRIGSSMFTSGIVNHNNPLRYHFDAGNYKEVWSAMFAFKKNIEGGFLSMPELDIGFKCSDSSLLLFDGQSILHGVTPITKTSEDAVRYTVVYYSLKQMWSCESPGDEIQRMRMKRAEIEIKKKINKSE